MSRLIHFDHQGTVRFITFSCVHRWKLLIDPAIISIIFEEIDSARNKHNFAIYGYVIMPNHVHLVMYPRSPIDIARVIGEIKSRSARRIFDYWRNRENPLVDRLKSDDRGRNRHVLWLPKCYDHNCRTIETVTEKVHYCHNNPVKAGLATSPREWKWSSFHWYHGDKSGLLAMDDFEA